MKETTLTFTITATKVFREMDCCKGCEKTLENAIRLELEDHMWDELQINVQRFEMEKDDAD